MESSVSDGSPGLDLGSISERDGFSALLPQAHVPPLGLRYRILSTQISPLLPQPLYLFSDEPFAASLLTPHPSACSLGKPPDFQA